jgi:hypothetical protein
LRVGLHAWDGIRIFQRGLMQKRLSSLRQIV